MAAPKLRFHDEQGREYPEWETKKIGDYFKVKDIKTIDSKETPLMAFVANKGIAPKGKRYDRSALVKTVNKQYKRTDYGDFIYSSNNLDVGSIGLNLYGTAAISPVYEIFESKMKMNLQCINTLIQRPKNLYNVLRFRQGVIYGQLRIHPDDFLKVTCSFPSLPEQEKISNFLTSYDHMIDTQSQRVEAMKTRKKGLLQKIFSQEIRFKNNNGQNYPEWEKKTVGSLANNIVGGGTPSTKNPAFYAGEIPWISSSDLVEDKINYLNMTRFITQDAINRSATKLIPAQSVMIVCRVGVGKVAVNELPLCTSQDFMNLIVKEENSPVFIGYLLMNLMVKRKNSVQGTAIKGIPSAEIKKFKVLVPALPEQQKIADFLTTVDAQIDVEEKRLETMKTIKKGLLQQMFI